MQQNQRRQNIMDNLTITEKIPPLTAEEIAELDALDDREIDLSDIPEITDEQWKNFEPANVIEKNLKIAG